MHLYHTLGITLLALVQRSLFRLFHRYLCMRVYNCQRLSVSAFRSDVTLLPSRGIFGRVRNWNPALGTATGTDEGNASFPCFWQRPLSPTTTITITFPLGQLYKTLSRSTSTLKALATQNTDNEDTSKQYSHSGCSYLISRMVFSQRTSDDYIS